MKILYVEDEIPHVELTQRALEDNLKEGFVLLHCALYKDALKILSEEPDIDIVLTDLRLPDGSGLDLLTEIKEMDMPPAVVLVTGQGDEQVAVAALKAGAADYLVKQSGYLQRLPFVLTNAVAQNNLAREQAAKREAEIRYQSLVEKTPAVVFLDSIDEFESTVYINPRIEELTGYSPEEWQSDQFRWENYIHPDDKERVLEVDNRTQKEGSRFESEYRFIRKDGQVVWIKEDTNLIRDEAGNPLYWLGILIDITTEKENAEALERQLKELTVLNAVAIAGAESTSENEIIERFVQLTTLIYNEMCGVLLLNAQGDTLTPHPSYHGANVSNWADGVPITQGVTGKSVQTGKLIRLGDIRHESVYLEIGKDIRSELCVPIQVEKRIIGVFNVESSKLNAYDKEDEQFLGTVAGSLGTALERLRLFNKEQQRNRELSALYQSTKSLTESLQPDIIATNLLSIMDDLLGYEFASIYLIDPQQGNLIPLAVSPKSKNLDIYEKDMKLLHTEKRALGQGFIGWVAQHGKTIRSGDVRQDDRYLPVIKNILSELCIPLVARNKIIGVINIETTQLNAYTKNDEDLLIAIANSAAIALENAQLYEAADARRKEAESLREATAALSHHIDLQPLLKQILDSAEKIFPFDSASIFLETRSGEMQIVATKGFSEKNKFVGRILSKSAKWHELALAHKALILPDAQADPIFEKWDGTENIRGWMGIPMISQEKIVGFINIDSHKVNAFSERDATLMQTFANSAAVAVQNARLYLDALRASERRAVLHSVSQEVVQFTQDLEQLYQSIHKAAEKLMPCDVFMITLKNEATDESVFVYTIENGKRYSLDNRPTKDGLSGMVINQGKSVIMRNDLELEEKGFPRFGSPKHVRSLIAVPMHSGNRITGMISAQSYLTDSYEIEEQSLLEMLATHAATAIENTRLYNETQRRLKEMETINRLSSALRTTQSQTEMCRLLLDETLNLLNASSGSVWVYSPATNTINLRTAKGVDAKLNRTQLEAGEGIVGHVFSTSKFYTTTDMKNDPQLSKENRAALREGFGGAGIPIYSTAGILGVLIVQIDSSRRIEDHISLLATLAEIAGNAIHRADLFDQSQDQVHKLTTLRDIDSAIASSTDLRVTLNILMDHALRHLKVDAVDILLYHPELQSLSYLCSAGFNTPSPTRPLVRVGEGLTGQAVMEGRIVQIPNLRETTEATRNPLFMHEGFVTYIGVPLIVKGQVKGLFEIFRRSQISPDHEWMQFMHTLAGQAAIAIDNSQLFDNLQRSNQEIRQAYDTTLEGWAKALELRDRETEGHTRRVTDLTMQLAQFMNIGEDELVNINRGVLLHDIGKMGVPDHILRKTGSLTDTEWTEMRKHPQYAYDLLSPIPYLRPALDIPYCHHEHWDGSGYPRGLKGTQIPLSARIFSIVDIWDALLSDRPYRKAWPREKVVEYLKELSGKQLDPNVVTAFMDMIGEDESKTG